MSGDLKQGNGIWMTIAYFIFLSSSGDFKHGNGIWMTSLFHILVLFCLLTVHLLPASPPLLHSLHPSFPHFYHPSPFSFFSPLFFNPSLPRFLSYFLCLSAFCVPFFFPVCLFVCSSMFALSFLWPTLQMQWTEHKQVKKVLSHHFLLFPIIIFAFYLCLRVDSKPHLFGCLSAFSLLYRSSIFPARL